MAGTIAATALTALMLGAFVAYVGELFDQRAHRKRWWLR